MISFLFYNALYLCQKFIVRLLIGRPLGSFGCPFLCISLFILMHSFCYCRRKICRAGEMACASVRTRHCSTSSCCPSVPLLEDRRWGQGNQQMLRGQVAYLTASRRHHLKDSDKNRHLKPSSTCPWSSMTHSHMNICTEREEGEGGEKEGGRENLEIR